MAKVDDLHDWASDLYRNWLDRTHKWMRAVHDWIKNHDPHDPHWREIPPPPDPPKLYPPRTHKPGRKAAHPSAKSRKKK